MAEPKANLKKTYFCDCARYCKTLREVSKSSYNRHALIAHRNAADQYPIIESVRRQRRSTRLPAHTETQFNNNLWLPDQPGGDLPIPQAFDGGPSEIRGRNSDDVKIILFPVCHELIIFSHRTTCI